MSRRDLVIPGLSLDRAAAAPLHRQLYEQLRSAIVRGALEGVCLPSTRVLAQSLGVSRNTVLAAYDELVADGHLEGRRGAGMVVAGRRPTVTLDAARLLRAAQYPVSTIDLRDPDGTPFYLAY